MDVVREGILLSRPESTIGLSKGNEQVHVLLQVDQILGILGPHLVVFFCVLQWCSTRVLLAPGTFESPTSPFIWEIDANEKIVVASAK